MDNTTITFLNGLAQLLGLLPQKEKAKQATTPKQKGGAIVKSQRGALTASPRGAMTPSPSGAMTPATGGGAMQPGGGYQGVQVNQVPPKALPPAGNTAMTGGGARGALAAGKGMGLGGALGGLGKFLMDPRSIPGSLLGGKILESAGTEGAAQMSLLGGDAPVYGQAPRQVQYPVTVGQADAAQEVMPKQPTAAATQAAIEAPPKVTKREQLGNSLNTMYMKARREAMSIEDPIERERALEAVAMMGMEFHKEYYGKPDEMKGRK